LYILPLVCAYSERARAVEKVEAEADDHVETV